jgi:4-amino-4-deoxy-L-arabinose transferase-like glycosyltransferase
LRYDARVDPAPRRTLLTIALVAIVVAALFAVYQRSDWDTEYDDQVGYQRLGHVLATTGRFTRYPDAKPFVPETIRTPVYPMFLALTYRVLGESHVAVAAAQAALLAVLTLVVYALTARLATRRVALTAAWFTALFPPLPYYAALALTEVLCTVLVTAAIWLAVRAVQDRRISDFILTGVFIGLATLTRPTYAMLPVALVGTVFVVALLRREIRIVLPWGWTLVAFAIVLAPWLAYNSIYVHRLTLSPAGGVGRATWEASWQGTWSGRVQSDLTRLVDGHVDDDDATLERLVRQFAAEHSLPPDPMLEYVRQWRDIHRLWNTPTDPRERALKRIEADDEYLRAGLANIARNRIGHIVRRVTTGLFVLWAAEIPIRYSEINSVPRLVIRAIWLMQAALLAVALVGLVMLVHRRGPLVAAPLAVLLAYITVVHMPFLAEARYSLPAKPTVLALAAIALAELIHRMLPQTGDYLP